MKQRLLAMSIALTVALGIASWTTAQDLNKSQLTLDQAIDMALENNLDIVVSRLSTQVQAENVGVARGAFKPLFSASINTFESQSPANNQLSGALVQETTRSSYNFSWQQQLSFGLGYSVSFDNLQSTTNSAFWTYNPQFDTGINAQVQQPLLKNLNLNANQQRVVVARNNERVARNQFEIQVMDIVRDVMTAYLDLIQSIRGLEVAERSLELAQNLLRNNRIQVEVGTMAPIDVLEAEAEVARREEGVIVAQEAIGNNEDQLKRLINDPDSDEFWTMGVEPTDEPIETEFDIDVAEAVRVALERRPELEASRVNLDTRNYNVRYTRNQTRPQVDLVGSLNYTGLGGTRFVRDGFAGDVLAEIPGGYPDALSQMFNGNFRNWRVGLEVSYPIGNSSEINQHAQAQVEFRQQRATIDNQELVVTQEVRATARAVDTNSKRIQTTRVARELAQRRLDAEEKKFEVGMSTSFFIVQAQRDLTEAAANEVIALIAYNKALVNFQRAQGTVLDRRNISVQ